VWRWTGVGDSTDLRSLRKEALKCLKESRVLKKLTVSKLKTAELERHCNSPTPEMAIIFNQPHSITGSSRRNFQLQLTSSFDPCCCIIARAILSPECKSDSIGVADPSVLIRPDPLRIIAEPLLEYVEELEMVDGDVVCSTRELSPFKLLVVESGRSAWFRGI